MKKKVLLVALMVTTSLAMTACGGNTSSSSSNTVGGNDIVESSSSIEISNSVEEESSSSEIVVDEPITNEPIDNEVDEDAYKDFITLEIVDGKKFVATVSDNTLLWECTPVDESVADVIVTDTDGVISYEVIPKVEGEIFFDVWGISETLSVGSYSTIFVDKDLNITSEDGGYVTMVENEIVEVSLDEGTDTIMQKVIEGLGDTIYLASLDTHMVNFDEEYAVEWVLGEDNANIAGLEIIEATEPMMSSTAFSLIVAKFDTNENAVAAADILKENAPIGKWICVAPDDVRTKVVNDNYVVLLMSNMDAIEAFDAIEF